MLLGVGVAAFWLLSGCIHDYECVGGATRVDGRCVRHVDAGVDASADGSPSTPEIAIEPSAPTTRDELRAVVLGGSEDPLGGVVELRYEWLLDGSSAGVTEEMVPADRTAKSQTWTVRVTPVAASRMGASAEASVTVLNSAPTVRSVGASSYAPRLDDVLRAIPSGVTDPDGDSTTYLYRWFRGDAVVEGVGSDVIDLTAHGFGVGDQVSIEVRANDGEEDGPGVLLGPLSIKPAVTAWVPRLPNRYPHGEHLSFAIHDEANDRVVWYAEGELWEFALDDGRERWVRLWPSGTPPDLMGAAVAYDRTRQQAIIVGGVLRGAARLSTSVYAVRLERGREEWRQLTVGGDMPAGWFMPSVAVDTDRDRLLVYGSFGAGLEVSVPPSDELWSLDLRDGLESWQPVDIAGTSPGFVVGGSWIIEPDTDVAWLVGGMLWDPETASVTGGGDQIWRLDATPGAEQFSQLSERLPVRVAHAAATFDSTRRRGLLIHGLNDSFEEYAGIIEFDPVVGTWTEVASESPVPSAAMGWASWDVSRSRLIVTSRHPTLSISSLASDLSWSALDLPWQTGPGPLTASGVGQEPAAILVVGGQDRSRIARNEVFRYALSQGSFSTAEGIAPDAVHGTPPGTWGWGTWGGEPRGEALFFGGSSTSAPHGPPAAWRIAALGGPEPHWHLHTLTGGSPVPPARTGAVVAGNDCFTLEMTVFGGQDSGMVFDDLWYLHDCNGEGRACTWTQVAESVPRPTPRTGAAASGTDSDLLVFGGSVRNTYSAANDLWHGHPCFPSAGLTELAPAGSPPPPRWGHTMTYNRPRSGETSRYYVFGGRTTSVDYNDVWLLQPSPWRWSEVEVLVDENHPAPAGRSDHVAAWDRDRQRLIVFGGTSDHKPRNDLWELRIVD